MIAGMVTYQVYIILHMSLYVLLPQGVKEVTLLGQNVNSYRDLSETSLPLSYSTETSLSRGFSTVYRSRQGGRRFADLLDKVSLVSQLNTSVYVVFGTF